MAELFEIQSALPTQRLNSAQQLEDVIEAVAVTKPHGVVFSVSVQKVPGWRAMLLARAAEEAAELESLFDA